VSLDTSICTCTSTGRLLLVNDAFLPLETDKNSFPLIQLTAALMGHGHSPTNPALSRSLQHTSSTLYLLYLYVYHRYGLELLRLETAMFTTMVTQQSPAQQGRQSYSRSTRISSCHSFILDATWLPLHVHQSYYCCHNYSCCLLSQQHSLVDMAIALVSQYFHIHMIVATTTTTTALLLLVVSTSITNTMSPTSSSACH
jgi:hypothetical protein